MMLEDWSAMPQALIPEASRSRAAAKASYRLLDNAAVKALDIAQSHCLATWQRMQGHEVVLWVCDTTSFNHTGRAHTEGLGAIGQGNGSAQGFFLHSVMAFSEQGDALGVLHAHTWAREPKPESKQKRQAKRNRKPLAQRESYRWTVAYEAVVAQRAGQIASNPGAGLARAIFVADRESDIYELFISNAAHDAQCGVLVRAKHPRRMQEDKEIVWDYLERQPELGQMDVLVPAQAGRPQRSARLTVRSAPVQLAVPVDKARLFHAEAPLNLWAIEAKETNPPEGCKALDWKLLTSTPAPDALCVQKQVDWYAKRWGIEVFHRTLKSGCRAEARQLQSLEKLERALSLDLIVAWRVLSLRDAARREPEAPATGYLQQEECEVLIAWATRKPPAGQPVPSIAQAVRWIARLGGYMDRNNDPPPGAQVIWRGMTKLSGMTDAWRLAKLVGNG